MTEYFEQFGRQEKNPEVEYTVPFRWGNLRVTKQANESYSLVALSANTVKGPERPESFTLELTPSVNITLIAPAEIPDAQSMYPERAVWADSKVSKDAIDMTIGLSKNRRQIAQESDEILNMIESITGTDKDELRQELSDENGIPFEESYERMVPVQIAHILATVVEQKTKDDLALWYNRDSDRRITKNITGMGAIAMGGTLALLSPQLETGESIVTPRAIIASGWLLGSLYLTRGRLKAMLNQRSKFGADLRPHFELRANEVAYGVHDTYCTMHFDANLEHLLRNTDDD